MAYGVLANGAFAALDFFLLLLVINEQIWGNENQPLAVNNMCLNPAPGSHNINKHDFVLQEQRAKLQVLKG